jgi:hypothetical protein
MAERLKKSKRTLALKKKKGKVKGMNTTTSLFPNAVWREGKYYVAQSLDVDISSFGKTRLAAIENLIDALESYALGKAMDAAETGKLISLKEAKKLLK